MVAKCVLSYKLGCWSYPLVILNAAWTICPRLRLLATFIRLLILIMFYWFTLYIFSADFLFVIDYQLSDLFPRFLVAFEMLEILLLYFVQTALPTYAFKSRWIFAPIYYILCANQTSRSEDCHLQFVGHSWKLRKLFSKHIFLLLLLSKNQSQWLCILVFRCWHRAFLLKLTTNYYINGAHVLTLLVNYLVSYVLLFLHEVKKLL